MKALLSTVCAATIALGTVAPLQAAPMFVPKAPAAETNLIEVQGRGENWIPRINNRRYRDDRWEYRRSVRRNNDYGWYKGHRGYRYHRPGYRRHGDFWFPAAAFIAGAIIASQPRVVVRSYGSAHVNWCYSRYRSYRAYDNTWQPYNGGRRYCYSPHSY